MNQITHWLDNSNVYGSDEAEASELRSFVGGRLRMERNGFGRELLPPNPSNEDCVGRSSRNCFLAGIIIVQMFAYFVFNCLSFYCNNSLAFLSNFDP